MTKVRIAAVQYELKPLKSFDEFAAQCRYYVEAAAGYKADFVLFPEMFTCQLLAVDPKLGAFTDAFLKLFTDLAKEHKTIIVGGSHFTVEKGKILNIAHVFFPDGKIGRQPKIHITPSERATWGIAPGNAVEVFDSAHGKFAVQICYDVEFPEQTRVAAEKGARLLFVPYCTDDRQGFWRVRYCAQARCIENQVYVAAAGVVGNLRGVRDMDVHYAQAAILTPCDFGFGRDGIAAEAPFNTEFLLVQELDMTLLDKARAAGTVRNWNDRRTDLYSVTWRS